MLSTETAEETADEATAAVGEAAATGEDPEGEPAEVPPQSGEAAKHLVHFQRLLSCA